MTRSFKYSNAMEIESGFKWHLLESEMLKMFLSVYLIYLNTNNHALVVVLATVALTFFFVQRIHPYIQIHFCNGYSWQFCIMSMFSNEFVDHKRS